MGHNPVGRAFLLADMLARDHDVELIGPSFDRYGTEVWEPIRQSSIPHRAFPASSMADFVGQAIAFVAETQPDIVFACKARLPSMLLGLLIKHRTGCPVILDVDDHELSFFARRDPLTLAAFRDQQAALPQLDQPYGESWTRLCETLVSSFDGLIVSNPVLQDRFGGMIVRHARDERLFRADPAVRARVREEFGYTDQDRVILFLGTPRAHKGIFRIVDALERRDDRRLVLCVIGSSRDRQFDARLAAHGQARVDRFPDQPWARLPALINMADGVCLLQDPASPIAQYQVPAKLSDALATGVPVAATDIGPFRDIPAPQVIARIGGDADLDAFLEKVAAGAFEAGHGERLRQYFLGELSYAVNQARLGALADAARRQPGTWRPEWTELFGLIAERSDVPLPAAAPAWSNTRLPFPAIGREARFDIAFFWKQNDSGIYGRRHDMLVKYLARHPRVGRILQLDAPIAISSLLRRVRTDEDAALDQGNLVVSNTIRRFLKLADSETVARRVFVHRGGRKADSLLGQDLPAIQDYPAWVARQIRETLGDGAVVSWVTPAVSDYAEVHDALGFSLTVADLIDDQRTMTQLPAERLKLELSYAEALQRADLAFANCASVREAFLPLRPDITVIANAAECLPPGDPAERPLALAGLPGPIIGYVGNLRDRIDTGLIARLARHRPDWQIVLIGSAHGRTDVLSLRKLGNVHFLGVKPYEGAIAHIRGFDVAIMPHLDNEISRAMSPLKLYVYMAAGVPIVTTAVSNIEEVAPFAAIADGPDDFVAKVEAALALRAAGGHQARSVPPELCWPARVEAIMSRILERA